MTDTKNSRGRPRKLDQHAAAETAMRLFWRSGYDQVGMAELTEALGVKSPSLYAAFGNKAKLFAAALDAYDRETGAEFETAFKAATPEGFVRAILTAAAQLYTRDSGLPGCLVMDGARNSGDAEAVGYARQHLDTLRDAVERRLIELGSADATDVASELVVAMLGLSGAARSGLDTRAIRRAADRLGHAIAATAGPAG